MAHHQARDTVPLRDTVSTPPRHWERLRWYGPGLLWMLSAVGTGSVLFSPRVGSVYGYELFWLLLLVIFFMWVMIREMARFTIVTGRTILDGMSTLKGPKGWAIWVIFVPQLAAAAVGIAGLAAVVGSAFSVVLPGPTLVYSELILLGCVLLTTTGKYVQIERISRYMAIALMIIAVISAIAVFPSWQTLGAGLVPQWPGDADLYIIAPWVGTILAGSMGIVWFSYWTATRGYGGGLRPQRDKQAQHGKEPAQEESQEQEEDQEQPEETTLSREGGRADIAGKHEAIQSWIGVMTGAAAMGVIGGGMVISAFLILGTELLGPRGIVPEGTDVASDLTRLFSGVWGDAGRYLILMAIIVAIGGSVLANQDGWGRSFADMTLILSRHQRSARRGWAYRLMAGGDGAGGWSLLDRRKLKRFFILTITGVIPALIILVFEDPVQVMSASGIIAALHTPFIVLTALLVNMRRLPVEHRPGIFYVCSMALAGVFYLVFGGIYVWSLAASTG